ncbi:hypothetical protein QR685DRAFT_585171 [Neurospora intermedia]|uniref:Uncharacterized protein n=1 Tax=Neurospora intermedia TaxID=5142 RepID=A0ABR3DFU0_NEUIN
MPSKSRKKEIQRAKQVQKKERVKTLQQQESTPTSPTPFSPSSSATHPIDPTQSDRRQIHTTLLQIKNLYTGANSANTPKALLSFLNSLVRFPATLPCCHGGEHRNSYRHIWPHSPLEDIREEGEEILYWIRYLDLIKQWALRRREARSWMKYYDAILGRMMEMQRGEAVVDWRVQKEERKRDLKERHLGKREEKPAGDGYRDLEIEQVIDNMALADSDDADDDQSESCQSTIKQLPVRNGEAQQLTKECIEGSEDPQPNNEAQEPAEKSDVRLSFDICRHLFKQLVPPDLDEEEHELSAEPCRLAFNQVIMTNADARQLTKDCIEGIEGLLDELRSEAEALWVGWAEEDAVEDGVGEDEDEDHHATSYDWMKDLMSADKTEGEDGENPVGLSEYWRYSKAYFHLYL